MASEPEGRIIVPVWVDAGVVKALINDSGRLPVSLDGTNVTQDINLASSDITLPVSEQTPLTTIQSQRYGWVASAWHKEAIQRGFSNVARSYLTATSTAAGWVYAYTGVCPSGYIRVVEGFTMQHSNAVAQTMRAGVWNTVTNVGTVAYQNCPQYVYYGGPIDLTLTEGEKFFIAAYASGAGITVNGYYAARQIEVGL